MPRHYVLGNHCICTLTKQQFEANTRATGSFEGFEARG